MRLFSFFPIGIALFAGSARQDDLQQTVDSAWSGHWTGTVTYRENCPPYARTVLPTTLDVSELPSGGLRMAFAYRAACGAKASETCDFVVSPDGKSVSWAMEGAQAKPNELFTVTEWNPEGGHFVMKSQTSDDAHYTIVFSPDELTVTKEIASSGPAARREYHFRRG